jgi:hypothetical protein
LQQEKADLVQRMEAMLDAADKEGRDLTADEEKDYQELEASVPALDKRIKREQDFLNAQASMQPIRDLNRERPVGFFRSSICTSNAPPARQCCCSNRPCRRLSYIREPTLAAHPEHRWQIDDLRRAERRAKRR